MAAFFGQNPDGREKKWPVSLLGGKGRRSTPPL